MFVSYSIRLYVILELTVEFEPNGNFELSGTILDFLRFFGNYVEFFLKHELKFKCFIRRFCSRKETLRDRNHVFK